MRTTERAARIAVLDVLGTLRESGLELPATLDAEMVCAIASSASDQSEQVQRSLLSAGRVPDEVVLV